MKRDTYDREGQHAALADGTSRRVTTFEATKRAAQIQFLIEFARPSGGPKHARADEPKMARRRYQPKAVA